MSFIDVLMFNTVKVDEVLGGPRKDLRNSFCI